MALANPPDPATSQLVALYLAKRSELVRFFTLRTSSTAEAEDIVQEISLKLLAVDDAAIENLSAFLYRLGSNVMLDRVRSRRRAAARDDAFYRVNASGVAGSEDAADCPSPEAIIDARQRLKKLIQHVESLPPQCRRVFVMHKFEDRSYAQVAEALGISRSAVEKHMITALKRLSEFKA